MPFKHALPFLLAALLPAPAAAQAPQFRFVKGQTLTYKVKHHTTASESVDGNQTTTVSKLDLVKRWDVKDVDAAGVATLHLTLTSMRNEQQRPGGDTLLFDSADFGKSTPGLREQMAKFVGTTLAILRVDPAGRVVEVKQGNASRYEAEPPFGVVLPKDVIKPGLAWARAYNITVDPPQGTGEKYPAEQRYECVKLDADQTTINVSTTFKMQPEAVQDRIPLLQKDVKGQVVFDAKAGGLVTARFEIDRTIENHQGPGTSYRLQSKYEEERGLTPSRVHGGLSP